MLCAEHLNAQGSHDFEKYWDVLSPAKLANGVALIGRPSMRRLNRVRVALKHHGAHPDQNTIALLVEDTAAFFAANTPAVFGLDYRTISLAEAIADESVRQFVRQAEAAASEDDHLAAMIALGDAFDELFESSIGTYQGWEPPPLEFGPTVQPVSEFKAATVLRPSEQSGRRWGSREHEVLAGQISVMSEVLGMLQTAMRITVLGIDFAAYQRFHTLTPHINKTWGAKTYRAPVGYAPSRDEVDFCTQFVVDAAIRLAAANAQLVQPSWRSEDRPSYAEDWKTIAEKKTNSK